MKGTLQVFKAWIVIPVVAGSSPEQVKTAWIQSIPMARLAEATEIGSAIAFLCSPAAAYITGVCLPVDGGRLNVI